MDAFKDVRQQPQNQVLTITLTPDGQLGVNGPLQNKLLCYGMLELARDSLRAYEAPLVQVAGAMPV